VGAKLRNFVRHTAPTRLSNCDSKSKQDDSMPMCLSDSHDDDSMPMCLSDTQDDNNHADMTVEVTR
jgi:hypothetical protein